MGKSEDFAASLMKQAQEIQEKMAKLQEAAPSKVVSASAGGGMVTVVANLANQLVSITMDREIINPDDPEMLADLIIAAANEALSQAQAQVAKDMSSLTSHITMSDLVGG
jgi:DNA-binding YbaB/EbfC family protein